MMMAQQYKYDPADYVDYLCESMTAFYEALPLGNAIDLSCFWQRIYFDTKQAVKEHLLSADERDAMLDYYGELIPDD
ncbi:MAG: imidazolonepropionase [Selenomonas massiliensis]